MELNDEKLIDEITNRLKTDGDVSIYKKNRKQATFLNLLSTLNNFKKSEVPALDVLRVRNQILDRISVPETISKSTPVWFGILRMSAGIIGTLLIVISLTLGTAVASLNSVPGQLMYPLKKIVENAQLQLAPQDQQSNLQIKFANNRVDELQLVLQQQEDGQISAPDAQKIVAATVKDLQKTTAAATKSASSQPKAAIADKLTDLSNKLKIASIKSEGQVKIELEQAISSIQQAGINSTTTPPANDNKISAQGKLTAVSETSVSIGTAKFLITKDTKYINRTGDKLSIGEAVNIDGEIKDNKTYANQITVTADAKPTDTSKDQTKDPVDPQAQTSGSKTDTSVTPPPADTPKAN